MCGRYSLGLPHAEIQALHAYNVQVAEWVGQEQFIPRYNIAPRSQAPVLRRREAGEGGSDSASDALIIQTMKWGLVPHWSKHEDKKLSTTNARSENLVESGGMWASIKGKRRCAVLCEGYYEWLKKGKERLPHFTKHKDGRLMLLAGLYDRTVLEGETQPLWTFTIVTTTANKDFQWLHDRQPVILSTLDALRVWLDTSPQKWTPQLSKLVGPYQDPASPLTCYQVPKEVGKVGTESPAFIQPIAERKDGIQAMFAKQKDASSSKASPTKKRKLSPSPHLSDPIKQEREDASGSNKPTVEQLNSWEDDSDIECIDDPGLSKVKQSSSKETTPIKGEPAATSQGSPAKRPRTAESLAKTSSPKRKQTKGSEGSAKITEFFTKS